MSLYGRFVDNKIITADVHFKLSYRQVKKDKNSCVCDINNRGRDTETDRYVQVSLPEALPCSSCGQQTRMQVMWSSQAIIVSVETHSPSLPLYKPAELLSHREQDQQNNSPSSLHLLFLLLSVLLRASGWNQESFTTTQEAGSEPCSPLIGRDHL